MSVFPVKLPLYPILNASDTVQRLLEKDAEATRAWPEKDSKGADKVMSEDTSDTQSSTRLTAVEGAASLLETDIARAGGETPANSADPDGTDFPEVDDAAPERLDMRS